MGFFARITSGRAKNSGSEASSTPRSDLPDSTVAGSTVVGSLSPRSDLPESVICTTEPASELPESIVASSTKSTSKKKKISLPKIKQNKSVGEASKLYTPPQKITKDKDHTQQHKREARSANRIKQVNKLLKANTQELMSQLTPEVRKAFETLFDRIDCTDSGGITAKEIQHLIKKHTNKQLTLKQIQKVLHDLDVKGTGDIEFDEFIFMLSQPSNYIRLLDKHDLRGVKKDVLKNAGAERLHTADVTEPTYVFFEALRNATKQDSMTALRTFYKNRLKKLNDHVIHDWSAGQRCIGLSDQEMLKRYETIQGELLRQRVNFCKDNSYKQSPYARPLEWGVMNLREAIMMRRRLHGAPAHHKAHGLGDPRRVKMSEFVVTPKAVPLPRYVVKKRSPLKRTFDYDQLADIREKVENIADTYYDELKHVARDNSIVVKKELAVDDIKSPACRQNFMHTFTAYCTPFVVSPWIPMPCPTLQSSFTPLGKSKLCLKNGL